MRVCRRSTSRESMTLTIPKIFFNVHDPWFPSTFPCGPLCSIAVVQKICSCVSCVVTRKFVFIDASARFPFGSCGACSLEKTVGMLVNRTFVDDG